VTNLERRLTKLEALRIDSSALVPNSPQWFVYWDEQMYFILTGREVKPLKLPPEGLVAVLRYTVQNPLHWSARSQRQTTEAAVKEGTPRDESAEAAWIRRAGRAAPFPS
jgi:hypothetical protein